MYKIGVDVGSTYTKYCVMNNDTIESLYTEKTPIRQIDYFKQKIFDIRKSYPESEIISCGYGKKNVTENKQINELIALARGVFYMEKHDTTVLDIGGQDTKVINQKNGILKEFFVNDKCAAGSGQFLINTLSLLQKNFFDIDLTEVHNEPIKLSSTCATFAQSEIVELIADNKTENEIIQAVIYQIIIKAKSLLSKVQVSQLVLSGGVGQIKGINDFIQNTLNIKCSVVKNCNYCAAIGCTI